MTIRELTQEELSALPARGEYTLTIRPSRSPLLPYRKGYSIEMYWDGVMNVIGFNECMWAKTREKALKLAEMYLMRHQIRRQRDQESSDQTVTYVYDERGRLKGKAAS